MNHRKLQSRLTVIGILETGKVVIGHLAQRIQESQTLNERTKVDNMNAVIFYRHRSRAQRRTIFPTQFPKFPEYNKQQKKDPNPTRFFNGL